MIAIFLIWALFALTEGVREGKTFAHGGYLVEWPYNIHRWFMLPRIAVWFLCLFVIAWDKLYVGGIYGIALWLSFPFFHDGAYYQTRRAEDFPTYWFFSKSTTTNALLSFGPWTRIIFLLISLILLSLLHILKNPENRSIEGVSKFLFA